MGRKRQQQRIDKRSERERETERKKREREEKIRNRTTSMTSPKSRAHKWPLKGQEGKRERRKGEEGKESER